MTKTISLGDVHTIGNVILQDWDGMMEQTKLNSIGLYSLISLKKKIQNHYVDIQDTVMQVALSHGGEVTDNGILRVPPEKVDEVNAELVPVYSQMVDIEYFPIKLSASDEVPAKLLEAFLDFIEIKE